MLVLLTNKSTCRDNSDLSIFTSFVIGGEMKTAEKPADKCIPKVIPGVGCQWLQEMGSWKILNPEYNVEFCNDDRCLKFIQENYPQFEFTHSHLKSVRCFDFIWYLIVYQHGCIYADSDITCTEPIKNWGISNETTFFLAWNVFNATKLVLN